MTFSRPGIIDVRARYRVEARRLRNTVLQDFRSCCTLWRLHNFISVLAVDLLSPQLFRTQYSVNSSVGNLKSNFIVPSSVSFLLRYLPLFAVHNVVYFSPKSEKVITEFVTVVNVKKEYSFFQQNVTISQVPQ
jgi:hypothetical protein